MIGRDRLAKWGKVNYKALQDMQAKIQQLDQERDDFCRAAAKELAARLLRKVKMRTPVGVYPDGSGKSGGTLRRNWTIGATIRREGNSYIVDVINPTEYAPYVEYGHRTRGGKGFVKGRFMLTVSVDEIQRDAPKILEKKLEKWLVEHYGK